MKKFIAICVALVLLLSSAAIFTVASADDCSDCSGEIDGACSMYGVISDNLPDGLLQADLITQPNSLKARSRTSNRDGWGIAYYPEYGDIATLERNASSAYLDLDGQYAAVVGQINASEPKITLAHIRACSSGCCDPGKFTIPNPHPFWRDKDGKRWTFIQNGGQNKTRLIGLIGEDYLNENPPNSSGVVQCYPAIPDPNLIVDSELYFLLLMKHIEENDWDVEAGIAKGVMELVNAGEGGGINFIMSDGYTVWAFRKDLGLYYLHDPVSGYSAAATMYPSSTQGQWKRMYAYELAVLTPDAAPVILDVRRYAAIDIKPGSYPNSINLESMGVVPVAVLTTDAFDASTVAPDTVVFAGAEPVRWTMEDVDSDGDMDMLFHFKTQALNLDENSTNAILTGKTVATQNFWGTNTVNIVPN